MKDFCNEILPGFLSSVSNEYNMHSLKEVMYEYLSRRDPILLVLMGHTRDYVFDCPDGQLRAISAGSIDQFLQDVSLPRAKHSGTLRITDDVILASAKNDADVQKRFYELFTVEGTPHKGSYHKLNTPLCLTDVLGHPFYRTLVDYDIELLEFFTRQAFSHSKSSAVKEGILGIYCNDMSCNNVGYHPEIDSPINRYSIDFEPSVMMATMAKKQ